jgi:hypothetical protein
MMTKINKSAFLIISLALLLLFSSWGYWGHRIVSENAPLSFPAQLSFLLGDFSSFLVDSALAADNRKEWDDSESPRHYIDIDNYPEFLYTGKISQSWDSIVKIHGLSFVLDNGTVPWSTLVTYDSLKSCFAREDWEKAALFAADLGHYVADAHNPLHLTANFDGQLTGQDGLHYRYETKMIGTYRSQIVFPADSAQVISNVQGYIFSYIYSNYTYVDSILAADLYATALAGNTTSSLYTQALWEKTKNFTVQLFHHAALSLASLIYTAYFESQHLAVRDLSSGRTTLGMNFPNPVKDFTTISFEIAMDNTPVEIKIVDLSGNTRTLLVDENLRKGHYDIRWDARGFGNGIYLCVLSTGDVVRSKKLVVVQ